MDPLRRLGAEIAAFSQGIADLEKRIASMEEETPEYASPQQKIGEIIRQRFYGFKRDAEGKILEEKPSEAEERVRRSLFPLKYGAGEMQSETEEQPQVREAINPETQEALEAAVRKRLFGNSEQETRDQDHIERLKRSHCMKPEYVVYRALHGGPEFGGKPLCSSIACREDKPCPFEEL